MTRLVRMLRNIPIQLQQTVVLSLFTLYAYAIGGIKHTWVLIVWVIVLASVAELTAWWWRHQPLYMPYSAVVTAMGIVLMLYSALWYVYLFAIAAAIAQKHLVRFENRHLFNPSNFGVVTALALFYSQAHIQTGQLGDAYGAGIAVAIAAWVILWEVKRWVIPLVYLGVYLVAEAVCVIAYDPVMTLEDFITDHYSVSFILFLFFMLTDPRTTPDRIKDQILYAAATAALTVALDTAIGMRLAHLFIALFFVSPIAVIVQTPASRYKKFRWLLGAILLTLSVIIVIEIQPPYFLDSQ